MKNIKTIVIAVILAVAVSYIMVSVKTAGIGTQGTLVKEKGETVYERVMRTGTIRCGYFIEPPFTKHDPNTKAFSGLSVDLITEIAGALNLKIEWAEEISFATLPQDLKNQRYDMVCGSVFIMPRAGAMDYTHPYAYVPIHGFVRSGDTRFDGAFNEIDWEKVTIAGLDGEGATTAVQKILPQAQLNILPQMSSIAELLLQVSTKKTDIGFVLPSVFSDFEKYNPGVLQRAELDKPLYTYAVSFGVAVGQPEFKAMIDNMLTQLTVSGELEALFEKHDPQGYFKRPAFHMVP